MGVEARCNLKCTMCPRNDPNFKEGEMPFSLFTMIMAQLPFLKEVQLSGLGEPLLHRDLFKMIRYLRRRRIRSVVVTNGTLLSDEVINEIFRSGLDVLNVSIDSADPEVYASIRVGARLKEIKENVKKLVDRKMREGSKLEVNINSILMRSNYRQVEDMIRLGWELGVDSISFSDIQYSFDVGISKGYESLRLASRREKREIRRLFERAQKLSKELNLRVYLPRLEQPKVRELCKQPWLYLVVKEDGRVRPCCGIHKREFGDLTKEGFKSIWNNDDFRSFR
jgi:MoaA/NifB/PqqE/SkfB family radical SAM enzyme